MIFDRRLRAALAALLLTFMSTFSLAVVDRAVCSSSDSGGTSCTVAQLKTAINEEVNAVDARAPMVLGSVAGTDDYTASVTPTLLSLSDGMEFLVKFPNANTTTGRININSIGLKAIVTNDGTALVAGQIATTKIYKLMYYAASDHFRMINEPGNIAGPASATDNAIARYDGTTGKLTQNSAATISDDGEIRNAINSGANAGVILSQHRITLNADYTLTSTTSAQKLFNTSTNGRITLPVGTYNFTSSLYLTTMSATSGNGAFDLLGAGTATLANIFYVVEGVDSSTPLSAAASSQSGSVTSSSVASMVTAATGTGLLARISGHFEVSSAGTVIPSIALVTAAAAVAKTGSNFTVSRIGATTDDSIGAWN